MNMNAYDHAHALARAISNSAECREYQQAKKKLEADKPSFEMLLDFRKTQLEVQQKKLAEQDTTALEDKLKKMFEVVNLNESVRDFLAREYRFAQMMADIQKILTEALDKDTIFNIFMLTKIGTRNML
jgi:cell fate (sporulation/competence/biofilm development) regulator YlbF (YheA/YmcA/DUF963 family)